MVGTGHIKHVVKLFQRFPCDGLKLWSLKLKSLPRDFSLGGVGMDWRSHVNVRPETSLRADVGENSGVTSMEDNVARLRESDGGLWVSALP